VSPSPYWIHYRDTFGFPVPPEEVWSSIEQVHQFEAWWSWLGEFRLEGDGLRSGSVLHGLVAPPLPYRMRVRVELENCVRPHLIEAAVRGDLQGRARLELEPAGAGTEVTAAWGIEMMQRPMRAAARFAHPLLRWGHDRVVSATVSGFRRHLQERRPA
jgi:carbon monoxide dehydrogenase subunit G